MQEALKNPYYKKIWEEVNWKGRHPEAKSLYSALMVEMGEHCAYGVVMRRVSQDYGRSIMFRDMYQIDKCNTTQRPEIIGRPITLEDVVRLWNATCIDTNSKKGYANVGIYDAPLIPLFNWQLTKPLHEQTPDTWEKIANLID